jgi:hypothetical protein
MQDIFWEHNPDHNFTKAVSQIDCLKDSDKLKSSARNKVSRFNRAWEFLSLLLLEIVFMLK